MKAVRSLSHRFSDDEGQIDAAAKAHARLTKKCVGFPPAELLPGCPSNMHERKKLYSCKHFPGMPVATHGLRQDHGGRALSWWHDAACVLRHPLACERSKLLGYWGSYGLTQGANQCHPCT